MASALQRFSATKNDILPGDETAVIPVGRLDADHYSADDLDGVTEGLFGSGGVSYASLQAAQTEESLAIASVAQRAAQDTPLIGGAEAAPHAGGMAPHGADAFQAVTLETSLRGEESIDTDRPVDTLAETQAGEHFIGQGGAIGATAGSVGASQHFAGAGVFTGGGAGDPPGAGSGGAVPPSAAPVAVPAAAPGVAGVPGAPGQPGINGVSGVHGVNGTAGQDGQHGQEGTNGTDGNNAGTDVTCETENNSGCDAPVVTIVQDVLVQIDQTLVIAGDTVVHLTDSLEQVIVTLGDVITQITQQTIGGATHTVLQLTEQLTGTLTETLQQLTCLSGTLGGLLDGVLGRGLVIDLNVPGIAGVHLALTPSELLQGGLEGSVALANPAAILNHLGDAIGALPGIGSLGDTVSGLGHAAAQLQDAVAAVGELLPALADAQGLPEMLGALVATVEDTVSQVQELASGALETLGLGSDGNVLGVVGDLAGGLLDGGLLGGGGGAEGDTDLVVEVDALGIALDVPLDPVEAILGDIDIDVIVGVDALLPAAEGVLADPLGVVGDLAGGLLDGGLLGGGGGAEGGTEEDTDLVVDADIGLLGLDALAIDAEIPLDPVEAILGDIDIDVTAALDLLGEGPLGGLLGGEQDGDATWTEADAGEGAGLFSDLVDGLGGATDMLPDPVGTVAEGLGVLQVEIVGGGGAGGGGLLGGLFG